MLLAHAPFSAIYPASRLVEASAITLDVSREPPFAVIRMGRILRGVGAVTTRTMQLWCHDAPGTYTRIDEALREARKALDLWSVSTQRGWLIRSEWVGDGEDSYDDGHKTIVRVGAWELTGTGE